MRASGRKGVDGGIRAAPDQTAAGPPAIMDPGEFRFIGKAAVAPDGTQFARKFRRGVFNYGTTSIGEFLRGNRERFTNTAPSLLRVMEAVSENEGKLEAFNTWDNAFLSFGVFQWTAGTGDGPGELAALLDRLKQSDVPIFRRYFGQFGLDVYEVRSRPGVPAAGFFSLHGTPLTTAAQKERLRSLEWAYRFFQAGHDDTVRQVEIEHALARLDLFYRQPGKPIGNRFVADYVKSEFGVALLLDQHVNRPGHVPKTLADAVAEVVNSLGADTPETWTDKEERRLLDLYIQKRANTSMTDSNARAQTVRNAVAAGLISDERGSFQV